MSMVKIAVFSDTHNNPDPMREAIRLCEPDAVIHCGDGVRDVRSVEPDFPGLPFYYVAGNCDFGDNMRLARTVDISGVKIYIAHGHTLGVKYGDLDRLGYAAREAGASVAFFGHTHASLCKRLGDVLLINPGSAGTGYDPTWGILEIDDNGFISWHLHHFFRRDK